jgi:hypothetical protein
MKYSKGKYLSECFALTFCFKGVFICLENFEVNPMYKAYSLFLMMVSGGIIFAMP